ncbi:p-hydroxycinnamoyl CoA hydratase/lyase [Sphingomonas sp. BHC-A]|uniref:p-hydroxycinnamoyl CoA hydratase/lyase n=1 Tax=Sphingobium indicum F2 TaxID=1450518 RepID=A0A8E1C2G1_9SPHN|nr:MULTISPECIES: p-hydroxycinnamoyl CoA hydratase/lyase [Sphingobium]EPR16332.1 crotonase [Sphingobium indicum IP26]EQB01300.1 crotonase [Sphingobium sp. HDIP04]KER35976.1 p-hydroxycinnamoyl CoA hydratase/lyase [Sphingobium indicum F2]KEZ00673.1 p-hydroxycinnamoyl CoA hydratase/lyase [Sphingomonas sp. BHC-A]
MSEYLTEGPDLSRTCVDVMFDEGIAWVTLNRPEKRNAMSPTLNSEMLAILEQLELDPRCGVVVLTGAGDSFSAGMDLKEYFRETDGLPPAQVRRIRQTAQAWQWRTLQHFGKPTIAMVNGWCFGGAFTPLVACDLAIAANEAVFGLSEINWGIIPGGNVTKAVQERLRPQDAALYIMTGRNFTGEKAAQMGLVAEAVPLTDLRDHTRALALELLSKNPVVLNAAKIALKKVADMTWDVAEDYLVAKGAQTRVADKTGGRNKGITQFLDEKSYKPGLEGYRRDK